MKSATHPLRTVLVLLAAILTLKAIVLWQLHEHLLLKPSGVLDDAVYLQLAERVAAGDWAVGPDAYYVSPLYIYFVGVLLTLTGGSVLAVRVVQVLLGTAAVGLMMAMTRRWFGDRAALPAGVLAGLTGLFTFYEILILQSALDPFLTALGLYLLMRAANDGARASAAAAGVAWGLLALNRPNVLPFLAVAALGLLWLGRWREGLVRAAAFGVATLVVIAPVTLRNRVVAGDWVLISSHGGLNFYIGNHERADGTYTLVEGITPSIQGQLTDAKAVAERAVGRPLKPSGVSDYFFGKA